MAELARVIGVHPIQADEPIHLIEIDIAQSAGSFDFGSVTQETPNLPRSDWQVAYDERELKTMAGRRRYAFFFHYLDPKKPLLTAVGELPLPPESPLPAHLKHIKYDAP